MSKVLITGGLGFIGSHTSLLLLQKGHKVYILDSNINSSEIPLKRLKNLNYSKEIDFETNLQRLNLKFLTTFKNFSLITLL